MRLKAGFFLLEAKKMRIEAHANQLPNHAGPTRFEHT